MKKVISTSVLAAFCIFSFAQVNNPSQVAQDAATSHANNDLNSAADKGLNKTEQGIGNLFKKKNKDKKQAALAPAEGPAATASTATAASQPATQQPVKAYQNYDFVPGERILFEDNFADDQDGEFPAHWKLSSGQAVVNKISNEQAFFLTEGNYARVGPRMKTAENYLPENFTVEFDFYQTDGGYTPVLLFTGPDNSSRNISFGKDVSTGYFPNDLSGTYPGDADNFSGKWHHAAMIKKGNQIKCYLDQFRVLVMPDCGDCKLSSVEMGGIGSADAPIIFRNFRLAEGGSMNMIGKKFTDSKIITHGINFDVDKSTMKPESMGTLNMIVQIMKDNPDLKFDVEGHTDNSGAAAHNLSLSQQRAEAVKTQLVSMGVDAGRLTTRGFGDTKPIADNSSFDGKANNRRVEFVKI